MSDMSVKVSGNVSTEDCHTCPAYFAMVGTSDMRGYGPSKKVTEEYD